MLEGRDVALKAYEDLKSFKLYHLDVGLLRVMSELSPSAVLNGIKVFEEFKGAPTEQFILSELVGMDFIRVFITGLQKQQQR
ncbi:MAG: DUF4143 domain-containing protein [Methanomicrobiales archaeon]|jgi:predicted AAA+ superfamily ATPase|nr:DUF4143 domain-containing protein [Methanomicrobiales archaeon]